MVSAVEQFAMDGNVRTQALVGGEILHTHQNRPQGLTNLLYNGYRHSFQWVMHLGCGIDHLPYSSTEVKEKVQLYVNPLSLCLQDML